MDHMFIDIGYVEKIGLKPQEILAVKEGIKPILRTVVSEVNMESVEKFCRENELHCTIKTHNELFGEKFENPLYVAYVSSSEDNVKEYCEVEKENYGIEIFRKFGELLGYPKCCVDLFFEILQKKIGKRPELCEKEIIYTIQTLKRTKEKPSFYLNNVFNFESRIRSIRNNKIIGIPSYSLISHIPCSYNCRKSMEYGKKVLEVLEREAPDFAKQTLHHIKRPVLFYDDFNWIVLDGEVKRNEIHYNDIVYHSLESKEILERMKSSKMIRVDKEDDGIIFDFC